MAASMDFLSAVKTAVEMAAVRADSLGLQMVVRKVAMRAVSTVTRKAARTVD